MGHIRAHVLTKLRTRLSNIQQKLRFVKDRSEEDSVRLTSWASIGWAWCLPFFFALLKPSLERCGALG